MKKRVMLFPYNKNSINLINNIDSEEYEIVVICSFKEDRAIMQQEMKLFKILTTTDFEKYINEVDIVIFCDNTSKIDPSAYVKKIKHICSLKKTFFLSKTLYNEIKSKFGWSEELFGNSVILENDYDNKTKLMDNMLYPIETPIVCIMGFGPECNKFQTHLELSKKFKSNNYKCLNIFSNGLGKVTGGQLYPNIIFSENVDLPTKIQMMNMYVHELEMNEKPDVIIISVPYGIMPINMNISNRYGELLSIVSYALPIDIGVLCIDFMQKLDELYCLELANLLKYKFSIPLDVVCISDVKKRFVRDEKKYNNYFLNRSMGIRCDYKDCNGIKIYSNLDTNEENKFKSFDSIILKLEENIAVF